MQQSFSLTFLIDIICSLHSPFSSSLALQKISSSFLGNILEYIGKLRLFNFILLLCGTYKKYFVFAGSLCFALDRTWVFDCCFVCFFSIKAISKQNQSVIILTPRPFFFLFPMFLYPFSPKPMKHSALPTPAIICYHTVLCILRLFHLASLFKAVLSLLFIPFFLLKHICPMAHFLRY